MIDAGAPTQPVIQRIPRAGVCRIPPPSSIWGSSIGGYNDFGIPGYAYTLPAALGGSQPGQDLTQFSPTASVSYLQPVNPNDPAFSTSVNDGAPQPLPSIDYAPDQQAPLTSLPYPADWLNQQLAPVPNLDVTPSLPSPSSSGSLATTLIADNAAAAPSADEIQVEADDTPPPPPSPPPSPTITGPIVLDLTGKGIKITPLSSSNTFFDMNGNGELNLTAWAGAGNAVLFYDPNNTNQITQADQVVFTDWDPSATNDMQALEDAFDTNHDGSLDAGDADFSDFKLMITNANGTTTVETLAQAGITSINLTPNNVTQTFSDGSSIDGETTYTTTSGTTGTAAAVTFAVDPNGYRVQSTTTTNATTGAVTVDNKTFNPDGSLAGEIISTTSANGLSETIQYDDTGDGQIDRTRTGNTVRRFAQWRRRPLAAFGGRRNGTTRRGGRLRRPPPARTVPRRAGTGGTLARRGGDARG